MASFRDKYHRHSLRLPNRDYSAKGWYFVTICTYEKYCYFGEIVDRQMVLSPIGKIAQQFWQEIPQHSQNTYLDEYTIMPNHIHGIIAIDPDRNKLDDRINDIVPYGDVLCGDISYGDVPCGDISYGDVSCGDIPYGDVPCGDISYGDVSCGDIPYGDVSCGDIPYGDVPCGDIPYGDVSCGDIPYGDVSCGDIPCRDVPWNVPTLDVMSDVKSNVISGVELDVISDVKSNVISGVELDVISDVKSDVISGVELDVISGIKSDGESNTEFDIESIEDFPEKMSKLSPKANSLSVIIRSYKSSVTRWCKQNNYDNFGWQSRFYEHIIRNDGSIDKIRQYIINNPSQWSIDRHNPVNSDSEFV
jgi:REP element-mobilizing transposase RayT